MTSVMVKTENPHLFDPFAKNHLGNCYDHQILSFDQCIEPLITFLELSIFFTSDEYIHTKIYALYMIHSYDSPSIQLKVSLQTITR